MQAALERAWLRLASPGTWLSAKTRRAVAQDTRQSLRCQLCAERKAALSPAPVSGAHTTDSELPGPFVEVIHAVRTDSGRLTKRWYESQLAAGIAEEVYVELVGIVATVAALDTFHRGLGVKTRDIPSPVEGEPSCRKPSCCTHTVAWVPTLEPADRLDTEDDPYPGKAASDVFNIHRALSLVPAESAGFFDLDDALYLPQHAIRDFSVEPRALTHVQMELLAARVSAINQCDY